MQLVKKIFLISLFLMMAQVTFASTAKLREVDKNSFLLDVRLNSHVYIKDIRVMQRKLDERWVLQLKFISGMKIDYGNGMLSSGTITLKEYKQLVPLVFNTLRNNNINLNNLQIELGLVDEYRRLAVAAIKQSQCNIKVVENKNSCLSHALLQNLTDNDITKDFCTSVKKYGVSCESKIVSMDQIGFRAEFIGRPFLEVANLNDAGLDMSGMWFSINLKK